MSDRLQLTFVSPRFLFPTDSGGKIRTTQILRGLKDGAFEVKLVMPGSRNELHKHSEAIEDCCDELVTWESKTEGRLRGALRRVSLLLDPLPVPVKTDWVRIGADTIAREIEQKPDVVVFDFPHSAILAPKNIDVPSVMFTHNIEAEIFHRHWQVARFAPYRMMWRNQYEKMYRYEKDVLSTFNSVVAVSERDRDYFVDEYQIASCHTIPTGVDTEFFEYVKPEHRSQVVFCGSMDWMANVDGIEYFFEQVWPLIKAKVPDATMKVVGRAPPEKLEQRIRSVAPEWEFTGFVDDVRDHICGAAAFVIPLRVGGGTRIKAYEAMAMGTPVISTSIGVEGLPIVAGEHYLVADEPSEFAREVVRLLEDEQLGCHISQSARALVEENFGFRNASSAFEEICIATARR